VSPAGGIVEEDEQEIAVEGSNGDLARGELILQARCGGHGVMLLLLLLLIILCMLSRLAR